jgi:uncharacterized membrane protein
MRSSWNFVRTTVIGGVIFLIPFPIMVYALKEIFGFLYEIVSPVVISLGIQSVIGKIAVVIAVAFIILILCFVAGLIVKLSFAKKAQKYFDGLALKFIPGYDKLRVDIHKKVNSDVSNFYDGWKAAFVKYDTEWKIGFIIEETSAGILTIFEPHTSDLLKGEIKMIMKGYVSLVSIENEKAIGYLKNYGKGASELLI